LNGLVVRSVRTLPLLFLMLWASSRWYIAAVIGSDQQHPIRSWALRFLQSIFAVAHSVSYVVQHILTFTALWLRDPAARGPQLRLIRQFPSGCVVQLCHHCTKLWIADRFDLCAHLRITQLRITVFPPLDLTVDSARPAGCSQHSMSSRATSGGSACSAHRLRGGGRLSFVAVGLRCASVYS